MLRLCVLGSGSAGNCIYVGSSTAGLLIDAGLSAKETLRRLEVIGEDVTAIRGICVSHEHTDHISGLGALKNKLNVDLYANAATIEGVERNLKKRWPGWSVFTTGFSFEVGDMTVMPFSVSHDAYDPVGFVIQDTHGVRVGIATDLGMATTLVRQRLRDCSVVVIEANHDERMLRDSARPWTLKQRILGKQGHLSNKKAAELVTEVAGSQLKTVCLAHMSADCNCVGVAVKAVTEAVVAQGLKDIKVIPTFPDRVSEVVQVGGTG